MNGLCEDGAEGGAVNGLCEDGAEGGAVNGLCEGDTEGGAVNEVCEWTARKQCVMQGLVGITWNGVLGFRITRA